jgi:hypothetical protein
VAFPVQMSRLLNNLVHEGLKGEEAQFEGTPFILFSITKDYSTNPHVDDKDYGFSFVIWLLPSRATELEHFPTFWLLEYKVNFQPTHGLVFLFNTTSTVHCTTSTTPVGIIRIALLQKTTYITKLQTIINNPTNKIGIFLKKLKRIMSTKR